MTALVQALILAHGDVKHAAVVAAFNGNKATAAALYEEAARLAQQARKAAGK